MVVIVHVTQQPPAEATIFWDNSFSEPVCVWQCAQLCSWCKAFLPFLPQNREPFVVPESVPWPQLAEALNCFFHANTSRGLTSQNLDYLGRRLLSAGEGSLLTFLW